LSQQIPLQAGLAAHTWPCFSGADCEREKSSPRIPRLPIESVRAKNLCLHCCSSFSPSNSLFDQTISLSHRILCSPYVGHFLTTNKIVSCGEDSLLHSYYLYCEQVSMGDIAAILNREQ